MVEAETVSDLI